MKKAGCGINQKLDLTVLFGFVHTGHGLVLDDVLGVPMAALMNGVSVRSRVETTVPCLSA